MTARLWVPLAQRLATRNWKRASSGWERTAAMVANRVAVSTPLMGVSVVAVMVDPFLGWESGRGRGRTGAGGFRNGGEHERLPVEGFAQLNLQLGEAVRRRELGQRASEIERLAQRAVTRLLVAGERLGLVGLVAQCRADRGGQQLRVAERVGHTVPGDRVAVVAGVADQRPSRAVAAAHVIGHPGDAADRRGEASVARPLADAGREPDEIGDERVAALGSGPADALQ